MMIGDSYQNLSLFQGEEYQLCYNASGIYILIDLYYNELVLKYYGISM